MSSITVDGIQYSVTVESNCHNTKIYLHDVNNIIIAVAYLWDSSESSEILYFEDGSESHHIYGPSDLYFDFMGDESSINYVATWLASTHPAVCA